MNKNRSYLRWETVNKRLMLKFHSCHQPLVMCYLQNQWQLIILHVTLRMHCFTPDGNVQAQKLPRLNSWQLRHIVISVRRTEATRNKIDLVVLWLIDSNKTVQKWMEFHTRYHAHLKTGLQCFQSDKSYPKIKSLLLAGCCSWLYCRLLELSPCLLFAHSGKAPKRLLCAQLTIVQMHFPSAPQNKLLCGSENDTLSCRVEFVGWSDSSGAPV